MRRFIIIISFLLAAASALHAQADPAVRIDTIQYASHSNYPLHLYLARPVIAERPLPCIVFVPGSAWKKQRMERSLHAVIKMAKMGYAAASVEYRPCNVALFPAQVVDAKTATRYLREHATELGLDSRNFFAWGSSSGGHTVLLQAFTQDSALLDSCSFSSATALQGPASSFEGNSTASGSGNRMPAEPTSCKVNAVVDYYGPSELVHEFRIQDSYDDPAKDHGLLLGDPLHEKRGVALKASPLYHVHPYVVPVFVVHGTADKVVPLEQSLWLEKRLKECGARVESVILEGQKHGGAAFWTDELLSSIDAFLQSCMIK